MRHSLVIVAVICAVIGDGWAQNRGSIRYIAPEDFDGDITRAPRPAPTRGASVRRTRPTQAPEPAPVEDELKAYQPPEIPVRTTGRRVPQRQSTQQAAPLLPPLPLSAEDADLRYPAPADELHAPTIKPEGNPQGTRRRRQKKRRRPQNAVPKEVEEPEKPAISVRGDENSASITELLHEDKKRSGIFQSSPVSPNNPSSYISDSPSGQQSNAAESQYYRPQPATNRLPVRDSDTVGNSRRYLDSPDVPGNDGPAPFVPNTPVVSAPNDASYVPVLSPIRRPSEGGSRLPSEDYSNSARPTLHSDINVPFRTRGQRPPEDDLEEINRDTVVKPVHNRIPQSDEPERGYSEVRLPENEQPILSEYIPPSFDSTDNLAPNGKNTEGNKPPASSSNRLPNPSEIHYDSAYPDYADYTNYTRNSQRRRQESEEPPVRNPIQSYSTTRNRGTKPQEYDNDAEIDRRQTSEYRPPLQRTSSRHNSADISRGPTRSRTEETSPSTAVPKTRGSSRYQPAEPEYIPERTRSSTRTRSDTSTDSPTRSRNTSTRNRGSQVYASETTGNLPRTSSRRQTNTEEIIGDTSSTGYIQTDAVRPSSNPRTDSELREHGSVRNTIRRPSSNPRTDSELRDDGSVSNTLRSRPQYEVVRGAEPVHNLDESVEDIYTVTDYQLPNNRQQNRPEPHYEPPQNTHSRPQYEAPQNTRSRQIPSRQNIPSSRSQGRARHQNPEPSPIPSRSSGGSNFKCPDAFGFFADPVQCDKYYECRNGTAETHLCHDGLAFNEISAPKFLRCDSLRDVDCKSRHELQEAQPTKNCPRKYGLFSHETDCTKFWNCVEGVSTEVQCPPGLIYNDEKATCDWADLVESSCKTEDLLGFTCPEPTTYDLQDGVFSRYPHPDNCQLHFTCIKGADGLRRPRMLSCNEGLVFDPASGSCSRPEEVPGCEEFYGPRTPAPKRKPARQPKPEPEPEEIYEEPSPRPRRRGSNRRARD